MPIRIPDNLPARKTLEQEGVMVMDSTRAARQDIRPLQIGLLNLMPNKERTETQFTRLIGSTPLQIELTLVRVTDHKSKNTSEDYLKTFYSTWEEVRERKFDGGESYLLKYGIPQFFFHVTTAYDLLRHNGVELGKADYMGER